MLKIFQGTYQDKQESVVGSTFKHEKPNAWLIFNPKMTQLIGYNMFTNELKKKKKKIDCNTMPTAQFTAWKTQILGWF